MNNYLNNSRSMNGLLNISSNSVNTNEIDVEILQVNNKAIVPTVITGDNSTNAASTAFVINELNTGTGLNYCTLNTNQTISGQKTFSNANTYINNNLVNNNLISNDPTLNINIGNNLTTGDVNIGTVASTGQNVALNWGTTSNSGQLTFRGGSFNLLATGDYTQRTSTNGTTNIDTTKTTGTFNMLTGSTWSGAANIGSNPTATGTFNIGSTNTTTNLNGNNTINKIKGQYIDLFAGQLRMFSASAGGSAIYIYVPPSGRSIMDFSTTDCDFVGQLNLTSANITCSIAPTTANEYCNKNYIDSNFVDLTTTQEISGVKSINSYLKFTNTFNSQYGSIGYNALNQWLSLTSTNNFNITAGGNTTYSNGGGIFNIKSNTLNISTKLNLNDNYDNNLLIFDCSGGNSIIKSYSPLTINATNPTFTTNAQCSIPPSNINDYCNKNYVDTVSNYNNLLSSNNTWTNSNTFNNFKVAQTTGDITIGMSTTNSLNLFVNGFPTRQFFLNFLSGQYPCIQNTTTDPIYILAGNGTGGSASLYLKPNFWGVGVGGINLGSRTNCQLGLDVQGDLKTDNLTTKTDPNNIINLNSPLLPSYNPSVLNFVDNIGSQIFRVYSTPNPTVGANKVISTEYLPVGVYICEFYAGWAQTSNNRAISITTSSTTIDNSRAQYSTQQNSSYQQLTLTTVIQNTVSTTPYYLMVQCGSNTGAFSSVQYHFRASRIA